MEGYLIKYQRIVEGEVIVMGDSPAHAQSILSVELACGTVPNGRSETTFVETIPVTAAMPVAEIPRV